MYITSFKAKYSYEKNLLKWNILDEVSGRQIFFCPVGILGEKFFCTTNEVDVTLICNREDCMPLDCKLELLFIKTEDLNNLRVMVNVWLVGMWSREKVELIFFVQMWNRFYRILYYIEYY